MLFHNLHIRAGRLTLVCVVVSFLLVACAKPTPSPEPVAITFAYPSWYEDHYDVLASEFHELYPHITVELYAVPSTVYVQSFWAGDADAFVSGTWFNNLRMMLEQDLIMDLAPFIKTDTAFAPDDFYSGEAAFLTDGGRILGVPFGSGMTVMYYNRDLFDQYGAAYPEIGWTWDDFLDAALALRDPEADVFGYVSTNPEGAADFVYQHGGQLYDDLRAPTYPTYDDPLTVEAMTWYAALFHEHDVAPTPQQARQAFGGSADDAVYRAIQNGQAGMWMGALWEQGGWGEGAEWEFAWGMVPLPRDARAATLITSDQLFVFADARNPDACWQWISFVSEHLPPAWLVPMRRSLGESEAYEQLVGAEVAEIARAAVADALVVSPKVAGGIGPFRQAVERITTGRNTPQEAMEWAQQEAERMFSE